jgi:hypothetical protein
MGGRNAEEGLTLFGVASRGFVQPYTTPEGNRRLLTRCVRGIEDASSCGSYI